jgi:hypothetical protein
MDDGCDSDGFDWDFCTPVYVFGDPGSGRGKPPSLFSVILVVLLLIFCIWYYSL